MKRSRKQLLRSATRSQISQKRLLRLEQLELRALLAAVAAPSGLISWWAANGSGLDVKGANNATHYNGASYAAGIVGAAFSFDGDDDRVQVADSNSLKLTASLTIEGWINVKAFPTSGRGYIFARGDDSGSPFVLNTGSDGTLQFSISPITSGGSTIISPLTLGQFTHVAATLDNATGLMCLYVNGVLVAQTTTDVRPYGDLQPASNPGIGIGNTGGYPGTANNSSFNGLIDELSVYDRALTQGEVLGIFKAGTDGKVLSPIAVNGPSAIEGATGTTTPMSFTIQRTGSLSGSLTVAYTTADDTANAGSDYVATSGTVTFANGDATKIVQVTVNGDSSGEANETFRLIVAPTGGTAILGVATILNDDAAISINNPSATEGDVTIRYLDDFLLVQSQLASGKNCAFGPDGNFYVASRFTNNVQKFDGKTGAYLGVVVPSGSFGLHAPFGLSFGPDGNLYVGGWLSNNVVRYNMTTGVVDEFLSSSSGVVTPYGLTFDLAGNLFVSTGDSSSVLRFQGPNGILPGQPLPALGQTGAVFVPQGSGGLSNAQLALSFGPDGNLYVGSISTNSVLRYNGTTGAFINTFVTAGSGGLAGPMALAFRPDGFLYVSGHNTGAVYRYNASTGSYNNTVAQSPVPFGAGGLAWDVAGNLYIKFNATNNGNMQTRYGRYGAASQEAFTVTLDHASAIPVTVSYSTANGTAIAGSDYISVASGSVFFAPGETSKTILVQTIDNTTYEATETFFVNLSNAVGATILTGQGIGTILDNEAPVAVVGTNLFYNNSYFDGNTSGATAGDDAAQATGKVPLRTGTATLANYTNYSRGINGLMVDVANLAGTVTADDFQFRIGNTDTPATWLAAPSPTQVTIRAGAGAIGSSRVTLVWPDNAIEKTWLQVTVRANANTGLLTPDVFYFGNAIGDVGDSTTNAIVNATDIAAVVGNQNSFLNPALITSPYDFNHDRQINATDIAIAVANQTSFLNALRLISLPAGGSGARMGSTKGLKGSEGSDANGTVIKTIALGLPAPLFERPQRMNQKADEPLAVNTLAPIAKLPFESSRVSETIASITDDKDQLKTQFREDDFHASIDAIMTNLDLCLAIDFIAQRTS